MHYVFNGNFHGAALTDPGVRRGYNEDNFLLDAEAGLLIVADGIGGHNSGALASEDAIRALRGEITRDNLHRPAIGDLPNKGIDEDTQINPEIYNPQPVGDDNHTVSMHGPAYHRVNAAIVEANNVINAMNQERGYNSREAMGTTIVGLYILDNNPLEGIVFHVGDSRLYLFRDRILTQITRDHSAYEKWVSNGKVGSPPARNILLQAIGPGKKVSPSIRKEKFLPNDIVLLCSDGLTDLVDDAEIGAILSTINVDNLASGCKQLVDAANANGGRDNITVILGVFSAPAA